MHNLADSTKNKFGKFAHLLVLLKGTASRKLVKQTCKQHFAQNFMLFTLHMFL